MASMSAPETMEKSDVLQIGPYTLHSRLILGTGKYPSPEIMRKALEESGTEMVTVAVRRVNLASPASDPVLGFLDKEKYKLLPNTAGCTTAEEAVRTAHL